jgi:uncharacterized membrane protein
MSENHSTTTAESEPVWSFRGYQIKPGEFNNAMIHLYRGEVSRANVWRNRLDTTTNWAVLTAGAAVSIAFSAREGDPGSIILSTLLVTVFLFLEARRYRFYELWSYRVRLMETNFYGAMLVPPFRPATDWAENLAESLLQPHFPISMLEALGRRFRRNYVWIYVILALVWMLKIWLHPVSPNSWAEFMDRAAIGDIPGWLVLLVGIIFNGSLFLLGILTLNLQEAAGEVFPRYKFPFPIIPEMPKARKGSSLRPGWARSKQRRQALLVYIITDQVETISQAILDKMKRGVTALTGTGMYTHQSHTVLMCVVTVTEVAELKALVSAADSHAFVIVSPAQEVLGGGFAALMEAEA